MCCGQRFVKNLCLADIATFSGMWQIRSFIRCKCTGAGSQQYNYTHKKENTADHRISVLNDTMKIAARFINRAFSAAFYYVEKIRMGL